MIAQGIDPDALPEPELPPEFQKERRVSKTITMAEVMKSASEAAELAKEPVDPRAVVETSFRVIKNIRIFMAKLGVNQAWLASETRLPAVTISRIMNHRRAIQIDELEGIAKALRVRPQDLLTGDPIKQEEAKRIIAMVTSPELHKLMTEPLGEALKQIGLPTSMKKFIDENSYRLTPDEIQVLAGTGPLWLVRPDPGEFYWRTLVRAHRQAMDWPPDEQPPGAAAKDKSNPGG